MKLRMTSRKRQRSFLSPLSSKRMPTVPLELRRQQLTQPAASSLSIKHCQHLLRSCSCLRAWRLGMIASPRRQQHCRKAVPVIRSIKAHHRVTPKHPSTKPRPRATPLSPALHPPLRLRALPKLPEVAGHFRPFPGCRSMSTSPTLTRVRCAANPARTSTICLRSTIHSGPKTDPGATTVNDDAWHSYPTVCIHVT